MAPSKIREGDISYNIPYMWNLKGNDTNELTKQKETHRLRKQTYGCWGKGYLGSSGRSCTHSYIQNGQPTKIHCTAYGTLSTHCYVPAWLMGRGEVWGRMDTCICMAESLRCSPETTTALFIGCAGMRAKSLQSCLTVTLWM